ncbi:glycine cleavage system protein GcvH [Candidatus Puniceispirillum sp.]|jgi:glycine cleavage system H protein|uniref:glycine cleavage system protein GcvH n=1 Tax=Candidatus Puniceispirillum sp. TaxID=2026719 RepID=UPI001ED26492|nr:glycine cleavage system protein GcvH [Candidatus Puniceispirillum sp.]
MIKYSEDHEWIDLNGDTGTVGISPHAIEQLGDIVFIELPDVGINVDKGDAVAVFESVKAASDIYSPASGEIIEVNTALLDDLSAITPESAMDCWLFKVKVNDASDLDEMMDDDAYQAMIA